LDGASKQATAWHFAEEQDGAVAVLYYYPSNWPTDEAGNQMLMLWKAAASPRFRQHFDEINIPNVLESAHPWVTARTSGEIVSGADQFKTGAKDLVTLQWQSWWNRYTLVVLMRRKPAISIISSFFVGRS